MAFVICLFQLVAEGYMWEEERKQFERKGLGFSVLFTGFFSHQPLGLLDSNYE